VLEPHGIDACFGYLYVLVQWIVYWVTREAISRSSHAGFVCGTGMYVENGASDNFS
jgi:hypothetical protein